MAAHQQVGSFEVVNNQGQLQKNGGNVASYFCTPDGRVVHAVAGPVSPSELLAEAQWAVENYKRADGNDERLGEAHRMFGASVVGLLGGGGHQHQIHRLLGDHPLPLLNDVYATVFANILQQPLSRPGDELSQAVSAFAAADRAKLPLLVILHHDNGNAEVLREWNRLLAVHVRRQVNPLAVLARSYVVVAFPLKDLPALSSRLGMSPYAAPDNNTPLFVVARSNGKQLTAVTSWEKTDQLAHAMAEGIVQEAKEHDRTAQQLRTLVAQVGSIDWSLAMEVQLLDPQPVQARPRRRR